MDEKDCPNCGEQMFGDEELCWECEEEEAEFLEDFSLDGRGEHD